GPPGVPEKRPTYAGTSPDVVRLANTAAARQAGNRPTVGQVAMEAVGQAGAWKRREGGQERPRVSQRIAYEELDGVRRQTRPRERSGDPPNRPHQPGRHVHQPGSAPQHLDQRALDLVHREPFRPADLEGAAGSLVDGLAERPRHVPDENGLELLGAVAD